jgi:hypothetical protein
MWKEAFVAQCVITYYLGIYLEGQRIVTTNISQDTCFFFFG